ncbi:MAG: hypothetical protein M0R47_15870 [Methylobacter sp.]|uniref:hypothetical protein n=1 Tax=Methylobacter sp. TaxID=2051955 RepID=UPI0025E62C34|nr:hypothetical protein [Methylobacter sp.]MCK9621998.1 hypothetical protein [Methylobacter sp.]
MATAVKNARTIVASATNSASSTTRGRLDLQTALGGIITMKITNGGTLGAQCEARILISHNATMPAAGSAGTDWKTVYRVGNGVVSGTVGEWSYTFGPEIMSVEVEFTGNTTNSCTVEAYASEITSMG